MILKCAWCAREVRPLKPYNERCVKWGICTDCAAYERTKAIQSGLIFRIAVRRRDREQENDGSNESID